MLPPTACIERYDGELADGLLSVPEVSAAVLFTPKARRVFGINPFGPSG
jgi:hypothetical protein